MLNKSCIDKIATLHYYRFNIRQISEALDLSYPTVYTEVKLLKRTYIKSQFNIEEFSGQLLLVHQHFHNYPLATCYDTVIDCKTKEQYKQYLKRKKLLVPGYEIDIPFGSHGQTYFLCPRCHPYDLAISNQRKTAQQLECTDKEYETFGLLPIKYTSLLLKASAEKNDISFSYAFFCNDPMSKVSCQLARFIQICLIYGLSAKEIHKLQYMKEVSYNKICSYIKFLKSHLARPTLTVKQCAARILHFDKKPLIFGEDGNKTLDFKSQQFIKNSPHNPGQAIKRLYSHNNLFTYPQEHNVYAIS